jgi:phytoene synthase
MDSTFKRIFKRGSKTYFYTSIFFPLKIKEDVFKLYSFVRLADNLVDTIPQKKEEFYAFKDKYQKAVEGTTTGDIVIDSFVDLAERKGFEQHWVNAFLSSMEADLYTREYSTIEKLKKYLYGSAEVIGLMMAKIIDLPKNSFESAMLLGRAMQYVNFIRDISEDLTLGRQYLPLEDLKEHNLKTLNYKHVAGNLENFSNFIEGQTDRFLHWQKRGEKGFCYIPKRYLIPIKTASETYKWTAKVIRKNPFLVYRKKVRPSILRIIGGISYNTLFMYAG